MLSDVFKSINFSIWWFLLPALILLFPLNSFATDTRCGVDTDLNGTVDNYCPSPDQDDDGYSTTDCDDQNHYIYPGISIQGDCAAGSFKTCQSNGFYTACAAMSTFNPATGSGATYFIDDDETTCTGTGAWNDEENWFCMTNTGMSGYHAPVAGDVFVFYSGNYNDGWSSSTRQIYLSNIDGTAGVPVTFMAAPGHAWYELGAGLGVKISSIGTRSSNEVESFELVGSNYINVSGMEMDGSTGAACSGIWSLGGSTGGRAYNNYIHDIRGFYGNNNCSGFKASGAAHALEWDHNIAGDNYDASATTNQNTSNYLHMDDDLFNIHHNTSFYTGASPYKGYGIKIKHGVLGASGAQIDNNIVFNNYFGGIQLGGVKNMTTENNYILSTGNGTEAGGISMLDGGSSTDDWSGQIVRNNTIVNSGCMEIDPNTDDAVFSTAITIEKNICQDDAGSYPTDGVSGFIRINHYGSDALYTSLITGSKLVIGANCYYNSAATAIFETVFGDNTAAQTPARHVSGTTYGTCAAMIAGTPTHTGSLCKNPVLNADGQATDTDCDEFGWLPSGTTTTTTVATTTTTSIGVAGTGGALPAIY